MGLKSVSLEKDDVNFKQVVSSLVVSSHSNMIEPEGSVARARPVGICLRGRALDLCVTNNQEIFAGCTNVVAYCSPSERAWEQRSC